ncbi:MAG: sulfotransferase domain-containing protein [Planctomycetota bacterium]
MIATDMDKELKMSTLPNFLVIGAFKGATTSLAKRLSEHPEIFMYPRKETHFFSIDEEYQKGLDFYKSYFKDHQSEPVIGEASPSYTRSKQYPNALKRIVQTLPDVKLIYILRHPIKRIESHWIEARRSGFPIAEFNEAVFADHEDLVHTSCYWSELNQFREFYSDDKILIVFTEDLQEKPHEVLEQCFKFLDVDPAYRSENLGNKERPSSGAYIDRHWLSKLRRWPLVAFMIRFAPRPLLKLARPLGRSRSETRPEWDKQVLERAIAQIKPDAQRVLEYAGKPPAFWDLDSRSD